MKLIDDILKSPDGCSCYERGFKECSYPEHQLIKLKSMYRTAREEALEDAIQNINDFKIPCAIKIYPSSTLASVSSGLTFELMRRLEALKTKHAEESQ